MYVLTFKNKSGEMRYYQGQAHEFGWYDCDSLERACKFKTKAEADAMRDKLNKISKENGWYGTYRTMSINN